MGTGASGGKRRTDGKLLVVFSTLATALALFSCEFIYGVPVQENSPDGSVPDRSAPDVAKSDAGKDGARDAGNERDVGRVDSTTIDATTYPTFDNSSEWSTFNAAGISPEAVGFAGGTFDGRYVYLAPVDDMTAVRYDTTESFTSTGSWTSFDTTSLIDAGTKPEGGAIYDGGAEFLGSAFDGKYVYLLPGAGPPAFAARVDTKATFTTPSSWETFDLAGLAGGNAYGFGGGAFDGRYVYMVPNQTNILARYDTHAPFGGTGGGWSTFNLGKLADSGTSFYSFMGAVFDGRYLYLVPGDFFSVAMRYDTTGPLASPSSWSSFDVSTVNFNARGFAGGAFDGRYIYYVPHQNGVVFRYDTTSTTFGDPAGWSFFNTVKVKFLAKGYFGGAFDGRYVYFVPSVDPAGYYYYSELPSGLAVRYDTTESFFSLTAWSTFDTSMLANAQGFQGAVFDGQYLYFVPNNNSAKDGIVARFQARTPSLLPSLPDFHGSFF
jgi:hypothetical protein